MTSLIMRVNYVDADVAYATTPADYIALDLTHDYLIWSEGDATVKDLMTHEPTSDELNAASVVIDPDADHEVPLCLLMDYSHDVGGSYYTHEVKGIGENKRYAFNFAFDGATASEPQLEAWDDTDHDSNVKHVLGEGTAANSMVKAVCTTDALPGASWVGTSLAGATNVVKLNSGNGALAVATNLYANIKIVVPQNYDTPAVETFILTVRFTWQ